MKPLCRIVGAILVATGVSGCEGAVDNLLLTQARESEVPGTYRGDYSYAKEEIILLPDHTFTQEVTLPDKSEPHSAKGKWSIDAHGNINLEQAFMVNGYFGRVIHPSFPKRLNRNNGIYRFRLSKKRCFGAGDEYGPCTD